MKERIERAWALALSVLLPIWNIWRLVRRAPGARQVVVAVVGCRAMYTPSPIPFLDWEEMIAKFGSSRGDAQDISVPVYSGDPEKADRGSTSVSKLLTISALLRFHDAKSALEIGTYMGVGTLWIAANLEDGGRCHTLDLPMDNSRSQKIGRGGDRRLAEADLRAERVFWGHPLSSRIVEHWGDSKVFDFEKLGSQVDFIYVDGEHSREAIVKDTINSLTVLADEGFVVWDDYLPFHLGSHPGVREFINWFNRSVDQVYDIGGQAAWFARLSARSPQEIAERCEARATREWPQLLAR